jgi:predicted RNase H-like nuclease (RuvC/YqgF family)
MASMNADRLRESIATVRTQIEDLQAELEAGARCADRIHADVKTIEDRVLNHLRLAARMTALCDCASELKKSIHDQRVILRDLRRSINQVRQSIRERKR